MLLLDFKSACLAKDNSTACIVFKNTLTQKENFWQKNYQKFSIFKDLPHLKFGIYSYIFEPQFFS